MTDLVWIVPALLVGLGVGFWVGRARRRPAEPAPAGPSISILLQRLMQSSHSAIVILNEFGDVVQYNPRAVELGVVRNRRVDARTKKAAELVKETGEPVEIELLPAQRGVQFGRGPEAVRGEIRPLGDDFMVVDAADESDAVRLEATRRDFVANVSHELKTPVGAMALLAEAVLDAADDATAVRRFTGKILHEATRLGTLVTELIALSRLQGAERLPQLNAVEVDAVVRDALGRAQLAQETTGIDIATDPDSCLLVEGDRTLLVTALANLLENAVAYSPPGTPVSISRRQVGKFVEIAVTDRGIGIPEDEQQRVFERFYRLDKARSRATGGTGLGLAIVKHVAANHGGEVQLWSRPGTGSTFTLRIPAHANGSPSGGKPGGSPAAPQGNVTKPSHKKQTKPPATRADVTKRQNSGEAAL